MKVGSIRLGAVGGEFERLQGLRRPVTAPLNGGGGDGDGGVSAVGLCLCSQGRRSFDYIKKRVNDTLPLSCDLLFALHLSLEVLQMLQAFLLTHIEGRTTTAAAC